MRMLHYGAVYFIQPLMLTAMVTMPTRTANVGLYRKLLRAAQTFESYNTRDYAVRYVRDDFRAAAMLSGKEVRLCAVSAPRTLALPVDSRRLSRRRSMRSSTA